MKTLFSRIFFALSVTLLASAIPATAQPAVKTGTVATPDGELYYEIHGSGPPIIMVAGGPGGPRTSLMPEFDRLATDHSVIYFDNIGRGRSSVLPAGKKHSPIRDAEDIERLRTALGLEKIVLIGHSYGGYPALAYATRHADRLERLVISSSGHSAQSWQRNVDNINRFVENQYPEVWAQLLALRAKGVASCGDEYQKIYTEPIAQLYWHDQAKAALRKSVSTDPRDKFHREVYCNMLGKDAEIKVGGAMASFDVRPALRKVHVPTLITSGRYDPVCMPKVATEIRDAFPKGVAKLRIFENSSHRPWVEETDVYFKELAEFLAGS